MGFVIAFPGSAKGRSANSGNTRQTSAEITIFPGVRYERVAKDKRTRDKDKPRRRFFDPTPQPG